MFIHVHIIYNFTNKPIAGIYYVGEYNYKEMLKLGKSNALGITRQKFRLYKRDYRSCALVTFMFLSNVY